MAGTEPVSVKEGQHNVVVNANKTMTIYLYLLLALRTLIISHLLAVKINEFQVK